MNGHVRPCNLKPPRRDLTPVLHRPVEPAPKSDQNVAVPRLFAKCHKRTLIRLCSGLRAYESLVQEHRELSLFRFLQRPVRAHLVHNGWEMLGKGRQDLVNWQTE